MTKRALLVVLEGTWWKNQEVPLVLPFFQALAAGEPRLKLSHRTIRSAADIQYYVSKISKNKGAMLYIACHGQEGRLVPGDGRSPINRDALVEALQSAKQGAVRFVHFACCEMVDRHNRQKSMKPFMDSIGAEWVSGYTTKIDWLRSMLLDLALVSELFLEIQPHTDKRKRALKTVAPEFVKDYQQLARELGFSAVSTLAGREQLFPTRLHIQKKAA